MGESLNPTLTSRLALWLHPDWARTVLARRVAAGGLVVLAGIAALRSDPDADRAPVLVAAHDLQPGTALTTDDVRLEPRPTTTIPDGAQTSLGAVAGATVAGATRRGEVLTDVRLLGARLAESTAGPDARIVPVHPADAGLIDLLRPGDVVDILAAAPEAPGAASPGGAAPKLVASNAVVVLVSAKQPGQSEDRVVLVALPVSAANAVAGAALTQTVTFTLH
ncbi:SAF domain-containing protein [Mycobacterium sp. pUA109]|uniref:SAF domain-containing protein n=1 Tax=Mycobacterium sp. pUA109 TaxID=3238982 RepID=UPI00351BA8C6